MSRISHSILAALVLAVLLATIGCGGGDGKDSLTPTKDVASGYGFELITEQISSLDTSLAENSLSMELKELKGDAVKAIITANGKSITGAAFAVEYDMNALTPLKVETGDFLGSDLLEFSLLDLPGEVPVAMTQMAPFTAPSTGSGVVAEIYFEKEANRTISGTPGGLPPSAPIMDLVATYNVGTGEVALSCTSPMQGDVNGDGRVSGPDVLYVGAHLGQPITGVFPYAPADCIDSDEDGFVSTGDIINIGIHYREEEDGIEFYKTISDTNLGPYTFLGSIDRPLGDGSDPLWDYCQPVYGEDTDPIIDVPTHFPYYYKAAAFYTDDSTGLTSFGPDSNFATGDNVVYVEVDHSNHTYGNKEDIILSFNVGALELTDNMTIHVEFDPLALDMDPASWVPGDFFGLTQSSTIFYSSGTGFFDLAISDINNPATGSGWLGDLTFEIILEDYQTNFMVGIDPLQGSFYEDALGNMTQFAAVGDTWAMWGDGHRPALGTPQCYRFFDSISEGDGTGNWEFWAAPDDQAEDTMWQFTDWTFCSGPSSLWFGEMGSNPPIYGDRAHDYVDSIPIDLTDFTDPEGPIPSLSFKYWHNFEDIIPPVDYAKLFISSYPYSAWDEITVFAGDSIPDGIGDDPENPNPCPDWTSYNFSLENYLGRMIKIRFEGKSDFSNPQPFQGMAIDNVAVGFTTGGGSGGAKKIRLLCLQEFSSDSYGGWLSQISSFEDFGLEEADEAEDDCYVLFNNYNSTYESYYMDEDLLADFNAIFAYNSSYYYGTLWGSQDERDMLYDWINDEEGRLFVWIGYHYSPRTFWYSTSYPNYDPEWATDFLGFDMTGYSSSAYRYAYQSSGTSYWDTVEGEMYEDLDGETLYGYSGSSVYAYDWPIDEDTTSVLGYLGTYSGYGYSGFTGWTPPAANAWVKDDNGSTVIFDENMSHALPTDTRNARTEIWFSETGFVMPMGESWDPETGECIIDDVLPSPSDGPGFGWGGGVIDEGGGGPTAKHASVLIVNDMSSDSYNQMGMWSDALEELGFDEDTSGSIGDDMYYIFSNYSGTYASYYITEGLLSNANAIFWSAGSEYYGTFLGSSSERQLLMNWLDDTDGAYLHLAADYFSTYYLIGYTGAPNYSPIFMPEYVGISYGSGSGSGYGGTWFPCIPDTGELLESVGNFQLHWWQSMDYYSFMNEVTLTNGCNPVAHFDNSLARPFYFHRHDDDDDYDVFYDTRMPSAFSGGGEDTLVAIMEAILEGCEFELP